MACKWSGQSTIFRGRFSLSTTWVPGIEHGFFGLGGNRLCALNHLAGQVCWRRVLALARGLHSTLSVFRNFSPASSYLLLPILLSAQSVLTVGLG